ncbi:MAG: hypothetical protein QXU35_04720 [Zestosphaera sp.]
MTRLRGNKVQDSIRSYARNVAPGLFYLLDLYCLKLTGRDCVTLLLDEPETLREIVAGIYGSSPAVRVIARMLLHPLKLEINVDKSVDELVELFMNNPVELRRVLYEHA